MSETESDRTYCAYCGVPASAQNIRFKRCEKHLWSGNPDDCGGYNNGNLYAIDRRHLGLNADDVERLRHLASIVRGVGMGPGTTAEGADHLAALLTALADRIAALLPPDD